MNKTYEDFENKLNSLPEKRRKDMQEFIKWMGLWNLNKIDIRAISTKLVRLSCRLEIPNGSICEKYISLNFIDRWKGISLDNKVKSELIKFRTKLEKENRKLQEIKDFNYKLSQEVK